MFTFANALPGTLIAIQQRNVKRQEGNLREIKLSRLTHKAECLEEFSLRMAHCCASLPRFLAEEPVP